MSVGGRLAVRCRGDHDVQHLLCAEGCTRGVRARAQPPRRADCMTVVDRLHVCSSGCEWLHVHVASAAKATQRASFVIPLAIGRKCCAFFTHDKSTYRLSVVLVELTYCFTGLSFAGATRVCIVLHSLKVQRHLEAIASQIRQHTCFSKLSARYAVSPPHGVSLAFAKA